MRKRLLSKQKFTFEKVIELATIAEQSTTDVDEMRTHPHHSTEVHRISNFRPESSNPNTFTAFELQVGSKVCPRCTYQHLYGKCKAYNSYCNVCHKKGHFNKSCYCKQRKVQTIQFLNTQNHFPV